MKKNLLLICGLLFFFFANSQTDTLTNETVIKLHQAGFGQEVIKSKINTSPAKFDVSINGMMKLKENKVPEEVINMMVSSPKGYGAKNVSTSTSSTPVNESLQKTVGTGIYLIKSPAETVEVLSSFANSKNTDRSMQLITPLISADIKVILAENHSTFEITDKTPKFQFVFDTLRNNNTENPWFGKSSSPKNFFLVKLKATKKTRELIIGRTSALEERMEINEKLKVLFKFKKTAPGVYEITPLSPMEPGEYGWVFSNVVWDNQSGKIFDFSIK